MQLREQTQPKEEEYEGFDLEKLKRFWREWVDVYGAARDQSFRDQEYYDGDVKGTGWGQWTQDELRKLCARDQPPTTRNHVARKVHAICGVEQRGRAEPRAFPRTPKDQKAAEVATDSLRFAKERARLNITSQLGLLDLTIAGYCGSEIEGAKDALSESHIEWRDIAFDPRSRKHDFSDARWLATGKWLDADVAKENYAGPEPQQPKIPPQPEDPSLYQEWALMAQAMIKQYQADLKRWQKIIDDIDLTSEGGRGSDIAENEYDDHPLEHFGDAQRKRIFVVDMWHKDPKHGWYRCVFTGQGKLFSEPATLVEQDEWGRKVKVPPLKFQSLFVSKDGWRYGVVRGMRSPQDEVNFRLSKALHWLMVNQLIVEMGALSDGDIDKARREAARPDGVITVNNVQGIKIERGLQVAAALAQMQADAEAFLETYGPNPQLQGEQGRATSGRAVLALQQAGLGQLGPIFDRFHDWEDRRYRSYWYRIQQFWTGPMYVRVTDDKNAAKFAAVNGAPILDERGQPKRRQMPAMGGMPGMGGPQGGMGPMLSPNVMMQPGGSDMGSPKPMERIGGNGGPPIDPSEFETGPMLAELDMDIIIDRAPEAATLQAEQFEELSKLAGTGIFAGIPPLDVARMVIAASALPNKTELLDMVDQIKSKPQEPNQMQMAELKELLAKIEKLIAERDKIRAETAKTGAEIPKTQAETARIGAEARAANVDATMTEFGATRALNFDALLNATGGPPALDPMAAASPPGAPGLPPTPANGPPPF